MNRPKVVVTQRIHPEVAGFLGEFSEPVLNESRDVLPEPELLALITPEAEFVTTALPVPPLKMLIP